MKTLKLPKANLDLFAAVLQQFGEVHAPGIDLILTGRAPTRLRQAGRLCFR